MSDQDVGLRELLSYFEQSPTMRHIGILSQSACPLNLTEAAERKKAFATCLLTMIQAMDAERISFQEQYDVGMFYGLMLAVLEELFDGRFGSDMVVPTRL